MDIQHAFVSESVAGIVPPATEPYALMPAAFDSLDISLLDDRIEVVARYMTHGPDGKLERQAVWRGTCSVTTFYRILRSVARVWLCTACKALTGKTH